MAGLILSIHAEAEVIKAADLAADLADSAADEQEEER